MHVTSEVVSVLMFALGYLTGVGLGVVIIAVAAIVWQMCRKRY